MGDQTNNNTQSIADYLAQLLKDKKQLAAFPNVFLHVERLLDDGKIIQHSFFFQRFKFEIFHGHDTTYFKKIPFHIGVNLLSFSAKNKAYNKSVACNFRTFKLSREMLSVVDSFF